MPFAAVTLQRGEDSALAFAPLFSTSEGRLCHSCRRPSVLQRISPTVHPVILAVVKLQADEAR